MPNPLIEIARAQGAQPIDLPAAADAAVVAAPVTEAVPSFDVLNLVLHASLPVQIVMVILIVASIASWVIIFLKKRQLDQAERVTEDFEERFWSGADMASLYRDISGAEGRAEAAEAIFEGGFREFSRSKQKRGVDPRLQVESAQRAMRTGMVREIDRLDHNLEFLASVGSISPYIGLFGTVWGIMISFQGLANVREATIATVAPGISEALIATAMGLFAAIPAVWAYNRYASRVERMSVRFEAFAEEFSSILSRHAHADE